MLRKIPIEDVRPGMFVTSDASAGLDTPLLYVADKMLDDDEDIADIRANGYTEALIDLSKSEEQWMLLYGGSNEQVLKNLLEKNPPAELLAPTLALAEELPKAKSIYSQALHTAQQVMEAFRNNGKIDLDAGHNAVENIMDSVTRNENALLALSKLRTKDDYTFSHCINVATTAIIFARHLGYDEDTQHIVGLAGFFHDLGKMEIPLEILNSPKRLTPEEFDIMRSHPVLGHEKLKKIRELPSLVVRGALEHHERVNGTGYPDRKKDEEISLAGKILAIVDVYDALSSRRVYKEAMPPHTALGLLYGMRSKDFVPELVDRFIRCIGIYPAGSLVKLNSGHLCVVLQVDPATPIKPQILVVRDAAGKNVQPKSIDLKAHSSIQIVDCFDPARYKIDSLAILESYAQH